RGPRVELKLELIVLTLALGAASSGVEEAPAPREAKAPAAPSSAADPLIENLEGSDPEKGALAARDLIAQAADPAQKKREAYLAYIRRALDPQRAPQGAKTLAVAGRLVGALSYTAASKQPYPEPAADLVLGLIGAGDEELRKAVHEAAYT